METKISEEVELELEYMSKHSNCCDALLINDMCSACKEHAGPQEDE